MKVHMTPRAKQLFDEYTLSELQERLKDTYMEMEQHAEPEGGPICDEYADEIEAYEAAIQTHKNRYNNGFSPFNNMTYDEAVRK